MKTMKRTYTRPELELIVVYTQHDLLFGQIHTGSGADAGTSDAGSMNTGEGSPADDAWSRRKGRSVWDDEDEEDDF